jgi:undecaprenyl diphosphate synthase
VKIPQHVAIIMDGNGRWAESRGLHRIEGHKAGAKSVRSVVEECRRLGVRYLTLYTFSTENWGRPQAEVEALMSLFELYLKSELETLLKNNIRLRAIGDLERLPEAVRGTLREVIERTASGQALDLVLAISYSGRDEIVRACREVAKLVQTDQISVEQIDSKLVSNHLWTADLPDPDLLIRTSGEMRISNFLLWQLAYAELVVTSQCWPDFNEESLRAAFEEYSSRERRFGLTGARNAT